MLEAGWQSTFYFQGLIDAVCIHYSTKKRDRREMCLHVALCGLSLKLCRHLLIVFERGNLTRPLS